MAVSAIGLFLVLLDAQAHAQRISSPIPGGTQTVSQTLTILDEPEISQTLKQPRSHAETADYATTAGTATTAGSADYATTAGRAGFAVESGSAEQADVATTLSPDTCEEGEILRKGASEWECVPMPSGGGAVFTAFADRYASFAFGSEASHIREDTEMVLPRDGWLRNLVVAPVGCAYGYGQQVGTVEVTVVINGLETDLSTTFDYQLDGCPGAGANLDVQVPVYLGEMVTFRIERGGNLNVPQSLFRISAVFD